ncbi:ATP-binding cassette domain-containing protein [Lachnospiraceae bacterium KK002]
MENSRNSNENNIVIDVQDLKIRYRCLNKMSIRKSLLSLKKSKIEIFEAVRGISFQVPKGEIMGIVGKNGSGKSTLLRAIAGVFSPDEGSIDLHGHSVSLLSIGVGFQKKLTGRENIYLSGMLLGFSEEEIDNKIEEIIEFSELGDFINRPVKTYSSGMYSKLAFSITAILETEVILIDEVLSVGDSKFKKKSYKKMQQLITNEDRTVIIVSHNNDTLNKLCNSILWLHEGKIKMQGSPGEVLEAYEEFMS